MFRLQRELGVRERHPDWPNWLAWADYLVIATVVFSVLFVVVPLVAFSEPTEFVFSIAAGTCAATSLLLLAYPFAILDHYGIEIGGWRRKAGDNVEIRHKGEPIERVIVITSGALSVFVFIAIVILWNH
jgi:hypothetical protein